MRPFFNPYNFVSTDGTAGPRRQFASLGKYSGKSGRIRFTLKTLSPLFIPDSEGSSRLAVPGQKPDNPHKVMDFFNVDRRLAIPPTSLKGMLRSVAEALSNSTFGVFRPDSQPATFRKTKDLDRDANIKDLTTRHWGVYNDDRSARTITPLKAAKIVRNKFDDCLKLAGDRDKDRAYRDIRTGVVTGNADLWQLHTGMPHVRQFSFNYQDKALACEVFDSTPTSRATGTLISGPQCKAHIDARGAPPDGYHGPQLAELTRKGIQPGPVQFWTVEVNGEPRVAKVVQNGRTWQAALGEVAVRFWPRHDWLEQVSQEGSGGSRYVTVLYPYPPPPNATSLPVDDSALALCRSAHGWTPKDGDIIRYYAPQGRNVVELGPVAMYRTPERASVQDRAAATPRVLPAADNRSLCPASRLFGWVPAGERSRGDDKAPVAGRVRVGVAWSDKTLDDTTLVPLRVLGGPKSKYYPFYLRPSSPREDASTKCGYYSADSGDWWHRPGQLRGRKFYLHHPAGMAGNALSYVEFTPELAKAAKASGVHTHQNATCAVLPVGAEFSGYVEFDSLADYELGMLLWAMALSDSPRDVSTECAHKLGMGRPIGMGSVRLKVGEVVVEDPLDGWKETAAPERKLNVNEARELVRVFKTWMMTARDGEQADDVTPDDARVREFDEQTSYKELCAVLRTDLAGTTPVCYPEIKYFLNQRQARNVGAEEPLKLPLGIAGGGRQDMDANASPPRRGAGGRGAGGGRGPERGRPEPRDRWNKQKRW